MFDAVRKLGWALKTPCPSSQIAELNADPLVRECMDLLRREKQEGYQHEYPVSESWLVDCGSNLFGHYETHQLIIMPEGIYTAMIPRGVDYPTESIPDVTEYTPRRYRVPSGSDFVYSGATKDHILDCISDLLDDLDMSDSE